MQKYQYCSVCQQKIRTRKLDRHVTKIHTLPANRVPACCEEAAATTERRRPILIGGERIATLGFGFGGY